MSRQTITAEGVFTHKSRTDINSNFSELYNGIGVAAAWNPFADNWFVNGDTGDDATGAVNDQGLPFQTIQAAVTAAADGDRIVIAPKAMSAGASDPVSYAETVIIPAGKRLWLSGVAGGPTQGGVPQIRIGAGSTAMLTVRSPGCVIEGLGFNGGSSTGGGILLDDDGSTKSAFGTIIRGCHFKNCKGHATNGKLGGGIAWPTAGGAWQIRIEGNVFYDNVCAICLVGTGGSRPKDIVIANNVFGASVATVPDAYIYGAGGSGFNDVAVLGNTFTTVLPNNTSGTIHRYLDLTGVASGIVANNTFGSASGTFGAAGNAGLVPTGVILAGNYIESGILART